MSPMPGIGIESACDANCVFVSPRTAKYIKKTMEKDSAAARNPFFLPAVAETYISGSGVRITRKPLKKKKTESSELMPMALGLTIRLLEFINYKAKGSCVEVNGIRANILARLIAAVIFRWCFAQLPVSLRGIILPRSDKKACKNLASL